MRRSCSADELNLPWECNIDPNLIWPFCLYTFGDDAKPLQNYSYWLRAMESKWNWLISVWPVYPPSPMVLIRLKLLPCGTVLQNYSWERIGIRRRSMFGVLVVFLPKWPVVCPSFPVAVTLTNSLKSFKDEEPPLPSNGRPSCDCPITMRNSQPGENGPSQTLSRYMDWEVPPVRICWINSCCTTQTVVLLARRRFSIPILCNKIKRWRICSSDLLWNGELLVIVRRNHPCIATNFRRDYLEIRNGIFCGRLEALGRMDCI